MCATPIGNLGDASSRLTETLEAVDVVYAEDTRRAGRLLEHLGVKAPLRSYFVGNERARASELAATLAQGSDVALVTDAGTPAISDPGLSAVEAALSIGAAVVPIPGPSAVTALLAASGLPSERFVFEGFLPRRGDARKRRLQDIARSEMTVVWFTTGTRIAADLADLIEAGASPDRHVVVGRELTKLHEEFWRGTLGQWEERPLAELRGEFTAAVGGSPASVDPDRAVSMAAALVANGSSVKDAAAEVSASTGVSKRLLYEALIKGRG